MVGRDGNGVLRGGLSLTRKILIHPVPLRPAKHFFSFSIRPNPPCIDPLRMNLPCIFFLIFSFLFKFDNLKKNHKNKFIFSLSCINLIE
uniref:Putative ovule protein n=1 Tax=Solanum chacoense TaxID=4108 RepID=A0A0V0H190_SOLCH